MPLKTMPMTVGMEKRWNTFAVNDDLFSGNTIAIKSGPLKQVADKATFMHILH